MAVYTTPFDINKGYIFIFTLCVYVFLTNLRMNNIFFLGPYL